MTTEPDARTLIRDFVAARTVISHGIAVLTRRDTLILLRFLRRYPVKNMGIDALKLLNGGYIQPDMEHDYDLDQVPFDDAIRAIEGLDDVYHFEWYTGP